MNMKAKTATYSVGRSDPRTSPASNPVLSYRIIFLSCFKCVIFLILKLYLSFGSLPPSSSAFIRCDCSIVLDTTSSLLSITLMSLSLVSLESIFVSMPISWSLISELSAFGGFIIPSTIVRPCSCWSLAIISSNCVKWFVKDIYLSLSSWMSRRIESISSMWGND